MTGEGDALSEARFCRHARTPYRHARLPSPLKLRNIILYQIQSVCWAGLFFYRVKKIEDPRAGVRGGYF